MFLQVQALSSITSASSSLSQSRATIRSDQSKYFDLLARYYVMKRQHVLAAHVLLRLAERRSSDGGNFPTLEQRFVTAYPVKFFIVAFSKKISSAVVVELEAVQACLILHDY